MTWSLEVVWKVAESRAKSRVRLKHDFTTSLTTICVLNAGKIIVHQRDFTATTERLWHDFCCEVVLHNDFSDF